jgi:hypothetical protein
MVAAFGGPPWEVPFEYQRNSPAYFKCDSSSMHWNLCHLPVNLTVGQDDYPWVYHAQDMYQLLEPIADTVYYEQTSVSGHGWEVISERQACEWLMNFSLNSNPAEIMINADEPDVYYWTEVLEQIEGGNFTRYDANYDTSENSFVLTVYFNLAGLAMNLNYMNLNSAEDLSFELDGQQAQNMELRLRDYQSAPVAVLRDGVNYHWWYYNSSSGEVVLTVGGNHQFEILMNAGADKNLSKTSGISVSHYAEGQNEVLILNINDLLSGEIEVKIFDLLGRERWDQYYQFASSNQIELHNFNLPSGIYFIQAKVGNQIFNHKLLIIK